jgi:hypothetical protein
MAAKKVSDSVLCGEEGINFVQKRVLEMGFIWHQRGQVDAGIDGTIELRNEETGEALNSIIQVQSKATRGRFTAETQGGLEYTCDERDLDYWLRGNAPVILVVSRPSTEEGYWISVKDYFAEPSRRKLRKVFFDKKTHRFDRSSRTELFRLGAAKDAGLYLGLTPKPEKLYSNLLGVTHFGKRIYVAETEYWDRHALRERLKDLGARRAEEWILRSKRVVSFLDLRDAPWDKVCDPGTTEGFDSSEWAGSADPDRLRDFVDLLNRCLREKAWQLFLRHNPSRDCYYFAPTKSGAPRKVRYESLAKRSTRTVFKGYRSKTDTKRISYYRHLAFSGQFRRYARQWFLEVTPTYHYTADGFRQDRWSAERLTGIKKLERNPAVLHQVLFWAEYLRGPRTGSLFGKDYDLLRFGELVSLGVDSGVPDADWLPKEEDNATREAAEWVDEPSLFDQ